MTPNELLSNIEQMDFDYFMQKGLERVPQGIDTREGAIIYDALAPAAYNFAEMAHQAHAVFLETYTQTATGEFLDYRAAERGLTRKPATYCLVRGRFTDQEGELFTLDVGTRFASLGTTPIYYKVTGRVSEGIYNLEAEQPGNSANRYVGQILPIDNMNGFGYGEITSIEIPARDDESDESLRKRILSENIFTQYGGNVADYISMLESLEDVGAGQVYPVWNGGGTVRLVIINNDYNIPTPELIKKVQDMIDPTDAKASGYGLAPIGHDVTVAAPELLTINFSVDVDVGPNVSIQDVKQDIQNVIQTFMYQLRKNEWGKLVGERKYGVTIYRSRVMAELLKIDGIVNVANLKLNGSLQDIELKLNNTKQELPVVGSVTINDGTN